jgi:hypothetical protein
LDALALERIRSTVPEGLRGSIVVGSGGTLDRNVLNAVRSDDANFLDLRTIANASGLMEVGTASGAVMPGLGWQAFDYRSVGELRAEVATFGVAASTVTGPKLFLGVTDKTTGGVRVTLSDGSGRAATAPTVQHAVTAAHEMYGRGLLMLQGKSGQHEPTYPKGPVNQRILAIEKRTEKLYEPR